MVSYQLEGLPHVADLVRLDEEEKLLKYQKRLDSLMKERKPSLQRLACLVCHQYEQRFKHSPVLLNIFGGYDSVREEPIRGDHRVGCQPALDEGASLNDTLITVLQR